MRDLAAEGTIGSVADTHYTVMGSTDPAAMVHVQGLPRFFRRGQVISYLVYQRSGIVDAIGDVPPAAAPASQ